MSWLTRVLGLERPTPAPVDRFDGWGPPDEVPGARLPMVRYDAATTTSLGGSSVANGQTLLGSQFDKGSAARPNPYVRPLTLSEVDALFSFNALARRIVCTLPSRACRRGWTVPEMADEDARLMVPGRVEEGMTWAQLYGGSLVVPITVDDVPPGYQQRPWEWLQQPLDPARVQHVDAVQAFDAVEASPAAWDRDPRSPTYRLPSMWRINTDGYNVVLHASRVTHLRGARRPPWRMRGTFGAPTSMPDDPFLQAVWDEIRRLTSVMNAGAHMAEELRTAVLTLSGLADRATGDEGADIMAQLQLMKLGEGLVNMKLIGPGDKYESQSNPPTGFKDLSDSAWEALAGATGFPQVILRGDTPGGLSTDDTAGHESFRQLVSGFQETHRHPLEGLYRVLYAAQDGPTGGEVPDGWALEYHALDEPDAQTTATTRLTTAQMDVAYINAGVYTPADVAISRFSEDGYSSDLQPVEPPDPEEEAAVALAMAELAAQAAVVPPTAAVPSAPARGDAAPAPDSCVVLLPAAAPGLRGAVEKALGVALEVEEEPHVTVLYLGAGLSATDLAEVVEVVGEAVEDLDSTAVLSYPTVRAFPPDPSGRVAVVLEYSDAYAVCGLNGVLLRALAHVCRAKQWPRFVPHQTLGYVQGPLTPVQLASLLAIDTTVDDGTDAAALRMRLPVSEVRVLVGGKVVLSTWAGMAPPAPVDPGAPQGMVRVRGHLRPRGVRGQGAQVVEDEPA